MKSNGYKVEFLPLERRMLERRFIDSPPSFFGLERRLSERREISDKAASDQPSFGRNKPQPLTH